MHKEWSHYKKARSKPGGENSNTQVICTIRSIKSKEIKSKLALIKIGMQTNVTSHKDGQGKK